MNILNSIGTLPSSNCRPSSLPTARGFWFSYNPSPEFTGTDTFAYRATDSNGASSTATVTITVS